MAEDIPDIHVSLWRINISAGDGVVQITFLQQE